MSKDLKRNEFYRNGAKMHVCQSNVNAIANKALSQVIQALPAPTHPSFHVFRIRMCVNGTKEETLKVTTKERTLV